MQLDVYNVCKRCEGVGSLDKKTVFDLGGNIIESVTEDPCTKCGGSGNAKIGYVDTSDILEDIKDKVDDIKEKVDEIKVLVDV